MRMTFHIFLRCDSPGKEKLSWKNTGMYAQKGIVSFVDMRINVDMYTHAEAVAPSEVTGGVLVVVLVE